ncbi:MAG TPA: PRC-barrel domain-containing protein [Ignavibacteriaceae bacterium]|nr:PRC-barrel domain-containing protein [Ignavibacteriaceae bacterium]
MLLRLKELEGYKIKARDGEIGHVENFFFDDRDWIIRYMIINTGGWLTGRLLLISPASIGKPNWENKFFPVELTKQLIKISPEVDTEKPVSRQKEIEIAKHFDWPEYWMMPGDYMSGTMAMPVKIVNKDEEKKEERNENPNLRDANEVIGYSIHAKDQKIGHVEDFIVNDETLSIYYLIIDTRDLLPGGKKAIVSISWIENIEWELKEVKVELIKEQIMNSPEWDFSEPVTRKFEDELYEHFKKAKYWTK